MPMMDLGNALWLAGILVEALLIGELGVKHVWRKLPAFCILVVFDFLTACGNYIIFHYYRDSYLNFYLVEIAVSSVLELCVLVELAWSVLRPIRSALSRKALFVVAALILVVGAMLWPIANTNTSVPSEEFLLLHLMQTVSFLRVLFFLGLAAASQWLSIGWRDRELQVATGLGFYSLVSLTANMLRQQQSTLLQYNHLNQIVVASYVCSLLYWAFSFAQKEAERREFTPQMQSLLLAVAGAARANRVALGDSVMNRTKDSQKP